MHGSTPFDAGHPAHPRPTSLPDMLLLAEVEPIRLGLRYHSIVCVRVRKPARPAPTGLAALEFGLEESLAAVGVAQYE